MEYKEALYARASNISRNSNGKPVYDSNGTKIQCDGIHTALKTTFYPWRDWKTISKTGSNKRKGKMIHRQLQHYYSCVPKKHCSCGLVKFKPSQYLVPIIQFLESSKIVIDDTEVPIYNPDSKVITWMDAIGHYTYNPNTLVKISLKTGYSRYFASDHNGLNFQIDKLKIPCTTFNVHHLQSLYEDMILKEHYNKLPDASFTLYVYKDSTDIKGFKNHKSLYPEWCLETRTRRLISKAMKENARAVLDSEMYTIEPFAIENVDM